MRPRAEAMDRAAEYSSLRDTKKFVASAYVGGPMRRLLTRFAVMHARYRRFPFGSERSWKTSGMEQHSLQ